MHYCEYIDIDRKGNAYILKVKHDVNKKQEPTETIMTVTHLGMIDHWDYCMTYNQYPDWHRGIDSGDVSNFIDRY